LYVVDHENTPAPSLPCSMPCHVVPLFRSTGLVTEALNHLVHVNIRR